MCYLKASGARSEIRMRKKKNYVRGAGRTRPQTALEREKGKRSIREYIHKSTKPVPGILYSASGPVGHTHTCSVWSEVFVVSIIDPPLGGSMRVA